MIYWQSVRLIESLVSAIERLVERLYNSFTRLQERHSAALLISVALVLISVHF